jgi:hypothetical protein
MARARQKRMVAIDQGMCRCTGPRPRAGGSVSNLKAALGVAQLEQLDEFVERKRRMRRMNDELLAEAPGLQLPLAKTHYAENI